MVSEPIMGIDTLGDRCNPHIGSRAVEFRLLWLEGPGRSTSNYTPALPQKSFRGKSRDYYHHQRLDSHHILGLPAFLKGQMGRGE